MVCEAMVLFKRVKWTRSYVKNRGARCGVRMNESDRNGTQMKVRKVRRRPRCGEVTAAPARRRGARLQAQPFAAAVKRKKRGRKRPSPLVPAACRLKECVFGMQTSYTQV